MSYASPEGVLNAQWNAAAEASITEQARRAPHVLLRPAVYPDGTAWCALYGENIQEGVAGFGATPADACADFDKAWTSQMLQCGEAPSKEAPGEPSGWQPIETAPFEVDQGAGENWLRQCLLLVNGCTVQGMCSGGQWLARDYEGRTPSWDTLPAPTHWMPLPSAPDAALPASQVAAPQPPAKCPECNGDGTDPRTRGSAWPFPCKVCSGSWHASQVAESGMGQQ